MPAKNEKGEDRCTCPWCTDPNHPPLKMVLHCPECGELHIDEGEFATKPHKRHQCQSDSCAYFLRMEKKKRFEWTPALINTVGVERLK